MQPVAYASVTVKGTAIGGITDTEGGFSLDVPHDTGSVYVSSAGYEPQDVPVDASKSITVYLQESAVQIEQVVITGFQSLKKETFTGSSTKVMAEDIIMPGEADISRMLEGRVAGVSIQNVSGTFGSAPKVRVRGATSIYGENKPLWVVDGVVLEDIVNLSNDQLSSGDPTTMLGSSVAGINANDIESMDILKDAAATALYGARAMNGVIVITTKKGKEGKIRINYSGNYTIRMKPRYSEYNIMNSFDQMSVFAEMEPDYKGYFNSDILNQSSSGIYGIMWRKIYEPVDGEFAVVNTAEGRKEFLMKHAYNNTDWFDTLFRPSLMNEHSLSVSGGSESVQTYASIGYLNDPGWSIAETVDRMTFNFRNDVKVNRKVDFALLANGSVRQQEAPGSLGRSTDVVTGEASRNFDINPFSYALNTSRILRPYDDNGNYEYYTMNYAPFNILDELNNNKIKLSVVDVKLQGDFNWKIADGLRYSFTGAARLVKSTQEHEIYENSNMANAYRAAGNQTIRENNPYLYQDEDGEYIVVLPSGGFYNTEDNQMLNYDIRNSLTYNKVWNNKHELNGLAGMQIKSTDRKYRNTTGYGFEYDMGGVANTNYLAMKQMIERNFAYFGRSLEYERFAAFYVNADYTYDRRYTILGTFRYDGSNVTARGAKSRWLPTWTVSGKWNIGNEAFLENAVWLDALALRASYGLTASMPPISNGLAIFGTTSSIRPLDDMETGIGISSLGNSELTWEKSYQTNVALDFTAFRGRLDVTVDYFLRKSFDLIYPITTSGIGGERMKYANSADMRSSGVDIMVTGRPVFTGDWKWTSTFTFGFSNNEIKRTEPYIRVVDLVGITGGNKNGYPVNGLFSIPFAGLDPTYGYPLFYDQNGDKTPYVNMQGRTTDFLKYEGPTDPKVTGGFNNTVTWKDLSLNIFFSFAAGNAVRLDPAFSLTYSDSGAMSKDMNDRWMLPGDEKYTDIPSIASRSLAGDLSATYAYSAYNYSDVRVARGDFIRLKSVSLSYNLPKKWCGNVFQNLALRVTGKNLWLLYSDKKLNGQDPEFMNTGGVAQPISKQVVVSLDVSF